MNSRIKQEKVSKIWNNKYLSCHLCESTRVSTKTTGSIRINQKHNVSAISLRSGKNYEGLGKLDIEKYEFVIEKEYE